MMMPRTMAAPTAGPEATMMVHRADWTMSSASAWFMSRHRDAGTEQKLAAVLQDGHGAAGDDADARHRAGDVAVFRYYGAADEALGLGQGQRGHERVELVVHLDALLDVGEGG